MKLGVKQMLPFEKNKEILMRLMKAQPDKLSEILATLRTLRWDGPKRDDLHRLVAFVQEVERTGTETTPFEREIEAMRRESVAERKKQF